MTSATTPRVLESREGISGDRPPHVCHVITGLLTGGAEIMLHKLLVEMRDGPLRHSVISLYGVGPLAAAISDLGIPVHSLELRGMRDLPRALHELRAHVRASSPDVLQGWMYHGNLAASLASASAARRAAVLWNIRQNLSDIRREKRGTASIIRLGAWLSRRSPRVILYNAQSSAARHEAFGYDATRRRVIPNGFDCTRFSPSALARVRLRELIGAPNDTFVVGLVGRHHVVKGQEVFLDAAALLTARWPTARFVMIGPGVDVAPSLSAQITRLGLGERVTRFGERMDVADLVPGFDVSGITSLFGEGFPNVVGEAMAAGVPCVVTDVGDAAWVVGDTGLVVPAGDATALAAAWDQLRNRGDAERRSLGLRARQRIVRNFSIEVIAREYESLYLAVARGDPMSV